MNPEISIKPYSIADKPKLLELLSLNVPKYFAQEEIEDFNLYLEHELELYYVASFENQIVGAGGINFEESRSVAKISWDFIHPDYHKAGIGTKLLTHRLSILQTMEEVKVILVRTSQFAYPFYQKNGFVLLETIKDYWAKGFDLYRMEYKKA
ncbi:GNAT family N-acetyltransferase [Flavobacterium sp. SM15]|uniref:GNAT family N-acetyltransferase n=1 Tax=Flavobacterium sp. SM15 TaxID=2908005 RepID=UPI001ED9CD93|nr:GNAT family N-acetyltransferase [Flavobacterium sp. SM15]MCG2612205.1 GNAT family N-acetyltransferase [Flavobacterium sp. SM15]